MSEVRLHLVPVRSREAKEFVRTWHRHHAPPAGTTAFASTLGLPPAQTSPGTTAAPPATARTQSATRSR